MRRSSSQSGAGRKERRNGVPWTCCCCSEEPPQEGHSARCALRRAVPGGGTSNDGVWEQRHREEECKGASKKAWRDTRLCGKRDISFSCPFFGICRDTKDAKARKKARRWVQLWSGPRLRYSYWWRWRGLQQCLGCIGWSTAIYSRGSISRKGMVKVEALRAHGLISMLPRKHAGRRLFA